MFKQVKYHAKNSKVHPAIRVKKQNIVGSNYIIMPTNITKTEEIIIIL